jgi:predicted nuclease of predicted toxin-antitoxin system
VAKYLIDANLPYYFLLWRSPSHLHLRDLDDEMSDAAVWRYARKGGWTIVTKDADFSARALLEPPPPRVIHIRFGNLKMRDFHRAITRAWPQACALSERCRLVAIFSDHIEGIE